MTTECVFMLCVGDQAKEPELLESERNIEPSTAVKTLKAYRADI